MKRSLKAGLLKLESKIFNKRGWKQPTENALQHVEIKVVLLKAHGVADGLCPLRGANPS
jgi:hypothetical protein